MARIWDKAEARKPRSYVCGYCGNSISSEKGFISYEKNSSNSQINQTYIYICHVCLKPTFFDTRGNQTPGSKIGNSVPDIQNPSLEALYEEARTCTSGNAYTSAVLACRKLLMHIAVDKGAKEGKSFIEYVEYLASNNYIPPDAKDWVDHIRKKGNEANHEIVIMKPDDAKDLLAFIEMLLRIIYEFPATIKRKIQPPPAP